MVRRSLAGAALAAGLLASGCRDADEPRAVVDVAAHADLARLAIESPFLPPGAEVRWVAHGLLGLAVPLERSAGTTSDVGEGRELAGFALPLSIAEAGGRASAEPVLEGLAITTRIVPGAEIDLDAKSGFLVDGARLTVVHPAGEPLPERFTLVYPVFAAQLAGTALTAGVDPAQLFRIRRLHGERATTALAAPAAEQGATLRVPLEAVPDARLRGALDAVAPPGSTRPVHVELRVGGEPLVTRDLVPGAAPLPLGEGRGIAVPGSGERVLELRVRGAPGAVVFLEAPTLGRARRRSDGPNVLFVLIDTLRADRLGTYGSELGLTPALDRLAAESLVFEQCWSGAPWTLPSVATMFTSAHGGEHLAWLDDRRLGLGLDTLAEVMQRSGRHTLAFTDGGYLSPWFGLDRGCESWDARGGGVERVVQRARAALEELGDEPWFLVLHTYEVHAPYEPPHDVAARVLARHPGALLGRTPEPHRFYELTEDGTQLPAETVQTLEELYDEEVRLTDRTLGAFLADLRREGVLDHTLVCVVADHGEEFGEHGLLGHGDTLYREQLHVPLLLRFPDGSHAAERDPRPVSLLDLAPTLLDAIGRSDLVVSTTFDGRSLLGRGKPSPIYAVRNQHGFGLLEAVREGTRVAIHGALFHPGPRPSNAEWQFYDLARDPGEALPASTDPGDPAFAQLARRLQELSEAYGHPRVEDTEVSPDAKVHAELRRLGYVGDD